MGVQEYYQMNRQMQLNNDLGARGNFLTQYQSYLAQLVGFFVIEDRVSKAAETLSGPQVMISHGSQARSPWAIGR